MFDSGWGFSAVVRQCFRDLNVDSAEGLAARLGRLHYGHLGLLPGFLLMWKEEQATTTDD